MRDSPKIHKTNDEKEVLLDTHIYINNIFDELEGELMEKVFKRNGNEVDYESSKVILAIHKAMADVGKINEDVAELIEEDISTTISGSEEPWTVEEISDEVENQLMKHNQFEAAKSYIKYRDRRKQHRENDVEYKLLSKEFLSKYKHIKSPMKQLGMLVYYRTYSRWLTDKKRREYWWETVARAVDYNCSLAHTTREEAEQLYDNIFNLRQFLSGRTFWVGGTDVAKHYKTGNFNCATIVIDDYDAYKDMFYLLMVGSGVGFRVLKSDVFKLPKLRTDINVVHEYYKPVPKFARREYTGIEILTGGVATIHIGDSKEGWTQALDFFLKFHYSKEYRKINSLMINYNSVRPYGERLKTFGGFASGHESMLNMLTKIQGIIQTGDEQYKKLRTIDAMDIANIIAENVVVGGVRRSAQICMIDPDDDEIINAKTNLYKQIDGEWKIDNKISHRQMSNNSIYYFSKPTRDRLHWQMERMRYNGEPAFYNAEAGLKRRDDFVGTNPLTV